MNDLQYWDILIARVTRTSLSLKAIALPTIMHICMNFVIFEKLIIIMIFLIEIYNEVIELNEACKV